MSYFAQQKDQVFKTITGDNGSEFAGLSLIEDGREFEGKDSEGRKNKGSTHTKREIYTTAGTVKTGF